MWSAAGRRCSCGRSLVPRSLHTAQNWTPTVPHWVQFVQDWETEMIFKVNSVICSVTRASGAVRWFSERWLARVFSGLDRVCTVSLRFGAGFLLCWNNSTWRMVCHFDDHKLLFEKCTMSEKQSDNEALKSFFKEAQDESPHETGSRVLFTSKRSDQERRSWILTFNNNYFNTFFHLD